MIEAVKLCECGCGNAAPIAKSTDTRRGYRKGEPRRFVQGHAGRRQESKVCEAPGCDVVITAARSVMATKRFCSRTCSNGRARSDIPYADRARASRLRGRYGITVEQFDAMVTAQNNRCCLCDKDLGSGRTRHVDHDHATGRVRGLLCVVCNTALGWFEGVGAARVAAYLDQT